MTHVFPAAVDRRSIPANNDVHDDDEEISSSFGSESGVHIPIIEGSVSVSDGDYDDNDDDGDSSVSDCESAVSGNLIVEQIRPQPNGLVGLVRLDESDQLYGIIGKKFVSRLSNLGINAQVESIFRNMFNASAVSQARLNSFQIFSKAVEKKNGGDVNIKFAWFGASKTEINNIIEHGFGYDNIQKNGVVLSADHSPLESVEAATVDDDGIKHILLCRVILGKTELVNRDSTQCHPSSDNFQTGVDDIVSPKKYVVWSTQMNTHILPEFVISFKTPNLNRPQLDNGVRLEKPVSPWIPIPELIAALSKILPPKSIKEITQYRRNYIDRKISRRDMIKGIREVAGDRVLLVVLKDFTEQRRMDLSGKFERIANRLK